MMPIPIDEISAKRSNPIPQRIPESRKPIDVTIINAIEGVGFLIIKRHMIIQNTKFRITNHRGITLESHFAPGRKRWP
jgi:hypothetical protein